MPSNRVLIPARGAKAESAWTLIQSGVSKSCGAQSRRKVSRMDWHERAVGVDDAVEPSVWDFKRKKAATWLKDAVNFGEGAIL
jgi:hypothetical protein